MKVVDAGASGADPRRVFVEDERTGERFVITTRVLSVRAATRREPGASGG